MNPMKRMRELGGIMAALMALSGTAAVTSGQIWTEVGDAGELPETAQWTAGIGALTQIKGRCGKGDHDMFVVSVTDAAHFKAIVTQGGDTKLGLFHTNGDGIGFNDDTRVPNLPTSTLDFTQNGIPITNGTYIVAILNASQMWANDAGAIWNSQGPNGEWDDQRTPDGPGAPGPVTQYIGNADANSDPYTITLAGGGFARQGLLPKIDAAPANVTTNENQTVAFSAAISGSQPLSYQWQVSTNGGSSYSPIAGATNLIYSIASVHPSADNQKKLRLVVTNPLSSSTSPAATLTVLPDTTPPSVVYARTMGHPSAILVGFSEGVDVISATAAANYKLDGVVFTNLAVVAPNTVLLRASSPVGAGSLIVSNITDQADSRNMLTPNPATLAIDTQAHGVLMRKYDAITGAAITDLTGSASFPDSPNSVQFLSTTEIRSNIDDYYGAVLQGYVTPPVTGDYTFYICSDDNGELLLSGNEDPAWAYTIATESGSDTPRNWLGKAELQSAPQPLEAGKKYYFEARLKESTGNDNLSVTWVKPGETIQANQPAIDTEYLLPFGGLTGGNPTVTAQPEDTTVTAGSSITLWASVTGSTPLAYQWYKNDAPIANATQPFYSLKTIRTSGGTYRLGVSNVFGFAWSSNAVLKVQALPGAWLEEGDAGDIMASVQATIGFGFLTLIQGTIPDGWDHDVYKIRISDFKNFSAVVTAPESGNSKLALIDINGMGVVYNDDISDVNTLSAIDYTTSRRPEANGMYYLGICPSANYFGSVVGADAVSIWSSDTPTAQQLPDGPGKDSPFSGFGGYGGLLVNYSIALTGVSFSDSGISQAVSLKVQIDAGGLVISWPAGMETEGFLLQQSEQLAAGTWSQTPVTPAVADNQKRVLVTPAGKNMFYRLSHP